MIHRCFVALDTVNSRKLVFDHIFVQHLLYVRQHGGSSVEPLET